MRPQAGVGKLKHAPPMQADELPVVGQALSPANPSAARTSVSAPPPQQFVTLRHRHPRTDVGAHPLPSAIGLYARELTEPRLEPLVPPMGDFQRLMDGVIGGQHAIYDTLGSAGSEVTVNYTMVTPLATKSEPFTCTS
jgi:hypothetical protein